MTSGLKQRDEREATGIVYCHGWGSCFDPCKEKIRALSDVLPVDGITVNYTDRPHQVFGRFAAHLELHRDSVVVGTSLGGFFAAWLGAEFECPFVAINPSIAPSRTLRAYLGTGFNFAGKAYELTEECLADYEALCFRLDGQGTIVLDMGDEVLNAHATLDYVKDRLPVVTFDGGSHRFDHMRELIELRPEIFRVGAGR